MLITVGSARGVPRGVELESSESHAKLNSGPNSIHHVYAVGHNRLGQIFARGGREREGAYRAIRLNAVFCHVHVRMFT